MTGCWIPGPVDGAEGAADVDEVGVRGFEQEGREGFGDDGGADDVGGECGFELLF